MITIARKLVQSWDGVKLATFIVVDCAPSGWDRPLADADVGVSSAHKVA